MQTGTPLRCWRCRVMLGRLVAGELVVSVRVRGGRYGPQRRVIYGARAVRCERCEALTELAE